jgi:hypothetical protein
MQLSKITVAEYQWLKLLIEEVELHLSSRQISESIN